MEEEKQSPVRNGTNEHAQHNDPSDQIQSNKFEQSPDRDILTQIKEGEPLLTFHIS